MTIEERNTLNELFYNAEEFFHYKKYEYSEFYNYVKSLIDGLDSIEDLELKKILMNWDYKNRIYKSLNINSITVPCDENIITNTLYGMMIRECGLLDVNPHPFILHIDYKFGDLFDKNVIDRFEWVSDNFHRKKFHIEESGYDISDEIKQYLLSKNYEIVYNVTKSESFVVEGGKPRIRVILDDYNINSFENLVELAVKYKVSIMYVVNKCVESKNNNTFRCLIDELIVKYGSKDFAIVCEDFLPGQHLCVDTESVSLRYTKDDVFSKFSRKESLSKVCELLKLDMIDKMYIKDECVGCDEKLLCMLGISDKDCSLKLI